MIRVFGAVVYPFVSLCHLDLDQFSDLVESSLTSADCVLEESRISVSESQLVFVIGFLEGSFGLSESHLLTFEPYTINLTYPAPLVYLFGSV